MTGKATKKECLKCSYSCMRNMLNDDDFKLINHNKIEISFKAGDKILNQGSFVAQFAYLKEGVAKKVIEGKNNRNTLLKVINNNEFIALSIFGNPNIYPFSIVAITDCNICFIRKETFIDLILKNEKANHFVHEWNANTHAYYFEKIDSLTTRNSHGKLAYTLMDLAQRNFPDNIFNYLSRKDLAELSTISIESTNKILLQLKNDGIISINGDGLKIERLDLIERLSTVG